MRTSEERKRLHLMEWGIIKNTGWGKEKALDQMELSRVDWPPYFCFACEEAGVIGDETPGKKCLNCPIVWGTEDHPDQRAFCEKRGSPYWEVKYIMGSGDGVDWRVRRQAAAKAILALSFKGEWVGRKRTLDGKVPHDFVYARDGSAFYVTGIGEGDTVEVCPLGTFDRDGCLVNAWSLGQVIFPAPPGGDKQPEKRIVQQRKIFKDVVWKDNGTIYPHSEWSDLQAYRSLLSKPPMTMTLEWEEKEVISDEHEDRK